MDPKTLRRARRALKDGDMDKLIEVASDAWSRCTDMAHKEQLEELMRCLWANHQYIVDYRTRLKREGIEVPEEWRGLGAAESNVNKFQNRVGKRGRSWAPQGISALLSTLTHLYEGTLQENICRVMGEREEWLLDRITGGAGHIVKATESHHTGVRRGSFPAATHGTRGFSKLFNRLQFVEVL